VDAGRSSDTAQESPGADEVWARRNDDLEGKVALVTGAAKGIGRGIALVLAEQGATVVVTDVDTDLANSVAEEARELSGHALALRHDVTNIAQTYDVVRRAVAECGQLDVLVNNAGVVKATPIWEIDEAEWDRVNDVNQKGLFFCCLAAIEHMKPRKQGVIINISSMAGREAEPLFSHYSATKFAAVAITQAIAKELAPFGIRSHAVCPGVVRTPLWINNLRELSQEKNITEDEAFQEFVDGIPLKRPQTPRDIGELVAFLASERSRNMTGQAIHVSGGRQFH
jgi:meso-butanediol dehydrogenase/(S,S)-butanediol dehydrogenase/diacetyl reductase